MNNIRFIDSARFQLSKGGLRLRLILLVLFPWLLSLLLYSFGLIEFNAISVKTSFFLFCSFSGVLFSLFLGVELGWVNSGRRNGLSNVNLLNWGVLRLVSLFNFICGLLVLIDAIKGGYSFNAAINDMGHVRHHYIGTTTWVTTLAIPFSHFAISFSAFMILCSLITAKKSILNVAIFSISPVPVFLYSFVGGSRQTIFSFILALAISCFVFLRRSDFCYLIKELRRNLVVFSLVVFFTLLSIGLISYVTVNRQDDYQTQVSLSETQFRYGGINEKVFDLGVLGFGVSFNYYFAHGIENLDKLINKGGVPLFDVGSLWSSWFLDQVERRTGVNYGDLSKLEVSMSMAAVNPVTWGTGFFYTLVDFGYLGSIIFTSFIVFTWSLGVSFFISRYFFNWYPLVVTSSVLIIMFLFYFPRDPHMFNPVLISLVFGIAIKGFNKK